MSSNNNNNNNNAIPLQLLESIQQKDVESKESFDTFQFQLKALEDCVSAKNENRQENINALTSSSTEQHHHPHQLRKWYHTILTKSIPNIALRNHNDKKQQSSLSPSVSILYTSMGKLICRLCSSGKKDDPALELFSSPILVDSINVAFKNILSENEKVSSNNKNNENQNNHQSQQKQQIASAIQWLSTACSGLMHPSNPSSETVKSLFTNQESISLFLEVLKSSCATTPASINSLAGGVLGGGVLSRANPLLPDAQRLMTSDEKTVPAIATCFEHLSNLYSTSANTGNNNKDNNTDDENKSSRNNAQTTTTMTFLKALNSLCILISKLTDTGDNVDIAASGIFQPNEEDLGVSLEAKKLFASSKQLALVLKDKVIPGLFQFSLDLRNTTNNSNNNNNKQVETLLLKSVNWISDSIFSFCIDSSSSQQNEPQKVAKGLFISHSFANSFSQLRTILESSTASYEDEEEKENALQDFDGTVKLLTPLHPLFEAVKSAATSQQYSSSVLKLAQEGFSVSSSSTIKTPTHQVKKSPETRDIVSAQSHLLVGDNCARSVAVFYSKFISDEDEHVRKQSVKVLTSTFTTKSVLFLSAAEASTPETMKLVCDVIHQLLSQEEQSSLSSLKQQFLLSGEAALRDLFVRAIRISSSDSSLISVLSVLNVLISADNDNIDGKTSESVKSSRKAFSHLDMFYALNLSTSYVHSMSCVNAFSKFLLKIAQNTEDSALIFSRQLICDSLEPIIKDLKSQKKKLQEKEKSIDEIEVCRQNLADAYNFLRSELAKKSRFIIIEELRQDCTRMREAMGEADLLRRENAQLKKDVELLKTQLYSRFRR